MPISDDPRAGHRKVIPALLCLALMAGCEGIPGAGPKGQALEAAKLDAGSVTVRGPAGYCVDGKSLRASGQRQFALLAQCDLLRTGEIEGVSTLSLLTVTAVRATADSPLPTAQQMAETFGPARILRSADIRGVRLVQLSDGGDRITKAAAPVHWRGVMQVAGHTLGLAAYSSGDGAATTGAGRDLLLELVDNIRAANGGGTGDTPGVQTAGN